MKKNKEILEHEQTILQHTKEKLEKLNLDKNLIIRSTLKAFNAIQNIPIPETGLTMKDVRPTPQVVGNFLHELIPIYVSKEDKNWTKGSEKNDKDLKNVINDELSIEIKTSSSKDKIYGNRSYGQEQSTKNGVKEKSGYYLAVNFENYDKNDKDKQPQITKIRIGYLEHTDWIAQKASTGQQARLTNEAEKFKLIEIYKK